MDNINEISPLQLQSRTIDILRFPLAVMVVAIHTYFCESLSNRGVEVPFTGDWAHWMITFFSIYLTDCAVPMFFVISGYLYFVKTPHITKEIYLAKTKSKCISLLVPFLCWSILAVCIEPAKFISATPIEKITNFWSLEFHTLGSAGPYNGPLWYLRDLFCVMLFSPLIEKTIRKYGYWPFLILIILYAMGFRALFPGLSALAFIYFSFGAWLAIKHPCFSMSLNRHLIFAVGIVMLVARSCSMLIDSPIVSYITILWIWCAMAFYYVIASKIALVTHNMSIYKKLAASSFVIYAMHRLINSKISCTGLILLGKAQITGIEAIGLYFITIILTISICYSTHLVIARYKILSFFLEGLRKKQ